MPLLLGPSRSLFEAAAFFVDSFWASGTTTGTLQLSDEERKQLCKQQGDDVRRHFPSRVYHSLPASETPATCYLQLSTRLFLCLSSLVPRHVALCVCRW